MCGIKLAVVLGQEGIVEAVIGEEDLMMKGVEARIVSIRAKGGMVDPPEVLVRMVCKEDV